jgi:heat shock protein HslJ
MSRLFTFILVVLLTTSCDKNKIIYVADTLVDCMDTASEKCLQIKENEEDEWTLLNQPIEDFNHKEGVIQKIEVNIKKIKNPPADSPAFKYKFVRLINEVVVVPFSLIMDQSYEGKWQVNTMIGIDSLDKHPTLIFKDGKVSGNAGCNNYGGTFSVNGVNIKFEKTFATKMYCTNMKIEKGFFNCLSQIKTYKLTGSQLSFYDKANSELMSCSLMEE